MKKYEIISWCNKIERSVVEAISDYDAREKFFANEVISRECTDERDEEIESVKELPL